MSTRISPEVLEILDQSEMSDGTRLYLPEVQLARSLYVQVNKVLESLGGKWNKKEKAHVFSSSFGDRLEEIIQTGTYVDIKKEYQFFETPKIIAQHMIEKLELADDMEVLEPSAGHGAIADVLFEYVQEHGLRNIGLTCVELNEQNCLIIKQKRFHVVQMDFMNYQETTHSGIIMNPPFSRQQDIDHVFHAWHILRTPGILVAIVSESPFFRTTEKAKDFRELVESHGYCEKLLEGSFKESGTMVSTRMVVLYKV